MKKLIALLLPALVVTACSKKSDSEDLVIPRATVTETSVDGLRSARLYKGSWRPTVSCTGRDAKKTALTADLWEGTLSLDSDTSKETVFRSADLTGKPLGTERTWTLSRVPVELAGSANLRLQLDRFGRGHLMVQSSDGRWSPQFDCQENKVPYEQKFVEAACDGDAAFVDDFMDRHGTVGIYINQIGVIGETALTCALKKGRFNVIETLLNREDSGLDLNAGNLSGDLPLFLAFDGGGRYAPEWLRLADLNRIDGRGRTLFHVPATNLGTLKTALKTKRLNPALLTRANAVRTTGLGSLIERTSNIAEVTEIFQLAKSVIEIDIEAAVINGQTFLDHAIGRASASLALLFLAEKPQQRLRSANANQLVLLAASSCDLRFVGLLDQRKDLNFSTTNGSGENAIDIVRRLNCGNAEQLVEAFAQRGVSDRLDPVTPACSGDATGFARALTSGGTRVFAKTSPIMTCIWNRPDLLKVMAGASSLPWDWSIIEAYAQRAIDSRDANLISIYLNNLRWPASGGIFRRLRDNVQSQTISLGQYVDTLFAQNAVNDANLRFGAYGHALFDLILADDHSRTVQLLQKLGSSGWPTLDLASRPEALEFHLQNSRELIEANGCVSPRLQTETPVLFALRTGHTESARNIASLMRQQRLSFGSQSVSCANSTIQLMNPIHLAVKLCQPDVIRLAYELGNTMEGGGGNKMTRRNAWDVLVRSSCSAEQTQALLQALSATVGIPSDREILNEGPNVSVVVAAFAPRYSARRVLTPFLSLPGPYKGLFLQEESQEIGFSRRDGRVRGGSQRILNGSGSSWTGYQILRRYVISFEGLDDYIAFDSSSYVNATKKGNCLVLSGASAALIMKDSQLSVEKTTVCPTNLRFKFNPTTSERNLPIRNHVDGDFTYSLDGLTEDSGT